MLRHHNDACTAAGKTNKRVSPAEVTASTSSAFSALVEAHAVKMVAAAMSPAGLAAAAARKAARELKKKSKGVGSGAAGGGGEM